MYQAGVVTNVVLTSLASQPAHTVIIEAKCYSMYNFGHKPAILHVQICQIQFILQYKTSPVVLL